MNQKNKKINKGAAVLAGVFIVLFLILVVRFGSIQFTHKVDGKGLVALAKERETKQIKLKAQRGKIFDGNGNVLAENIPAFNVIAVLSKKAKPNCVLNPQKTAAELSPILHMKTAKLMNLLKKKAYEVQLGPGGNRISYSEMEKIKSLKLPGILFTTQSKRYYPDDMFASHVVGLTSRDPKTDKLKGVMGIEKFFNKDLTGQPGSVKYMSSPNGVQLPGTSQQKKPAKNGDNVYLTLDSHIQMFLEQAINKQVKKYHPKRVMAIVMDPKTGKILAMANRPSFNPNKGNA